MNKPVTSSIGASGQRGVVLFVALILLLILSLLGVTAARMQTSEERMARNEDNHQIGAQAAEAALRSAESNLRTGLYTFPSSSPGMYTPTWATGSPVTTVDWTSPAAVMSYSGPPLSSLPTAAQTPKIVVESLPAVAGGGSSISVTNLNPNTPPVVVYRVTAHGTGADGTSTTTLQSIVQYTIR
jgi:type IV pilus assembly protein PilX